ncbi:putative E3 ubiquitin-protein ligase SINA-like 6 [Raphanus sativus]|uniref:E3 ubiquitin-protein ligase SINA-like 9 n=1 Tax=Raphanus sativus TaxID=3726 RepID=A0A6J0NDU3_RAPSA|nr:putative E3 ubiquitin-protein ligase SINA-like 9 [Raphanus sativus]KAJ4902976.1 putative E3 ubiquitin-protein ligase SINA-like 6 [Raphanus sativus]
MESFDSEDDDNVLTNSTSRKRQRSPTERTATLQDLDVTDCPICFHPLTIPIFQCDNGHIACSTCCEKLSQKCATCTLPTLSRNRAMERVIELLTVRCPNAGCSVVVSCSETSSHVNNHCPFTQRNCPFSGCDFTCSFKDLYKHSLAKHSLAAPCVAKLHKSFPSRMFKCGTPEPLYFATDKRTILKERTTQGEGEIVVVEWFDMPDGRVLYACCIGPGADKFSYQLKLTSVYGDDLLFNSNLKRVCEVSNEPPRARFMLAPSCMLPYRECSICIKRETQ